MPIAVTPTQLFLSTYFSNAARPAAAWPAARQGNGWRPGWPAWQSLRPLTRRSYQHHLDTYLLPCIGNITLAMLTAADLRVMFTAIARQRPAAGGPLSPATLARIRATLRTALNAASRERLISVNPARLVELPAPARPHPVVWTAPREAAWREAGERPAVAVWTAEQTARFLAVIRGEPLYPCYQLMAVSGLRRGEAPGSAGATSTSPEPR